MRQSMKLLGRIIAMLVIFSLAGISHAINIDNNDNLSVSPISSPSSGSDFDKLRVKFLGFLKSIKTDMPFTTTQYVKEWVLKDWETQQDDYQIINVSSKNTVNKGHIPNTVNIPLEDLLTDINLKKLDSMMTNIVYSDSFHTSVTASVIFNLLEYKSYKLSFNANEWSLPNNSDKGFEQTFSYSIYGGKDTSNITYDLPETANTNIALDKLLISRYISKVSNKKTVFSSAQVKKIIDNWEWSQEKYQIISVLNEKHFEMGHLQGAINIPIFNLMNEDQLKRIDPNKTTLIYCKSGDLAQVSATLLNMLGYNAVNIRYGMTGWENKLISEK